MREQGITENTPTRLREAVIVASAFVGGALWINTRLVGLENSTDRLVYRLETIERVAGAAASEDQLRWFAEDLAEQNPTMKVPKVR